MGVQKLFQVGSVETFDTFLGVLLLLEGESAHHLQSYLVLDNLEEELLQTVAQRVI